MVSSLIGTDALCMPTASWWTSLPFLATMTTAPRKLPSATSFFSAALIFASRCDDMPTVSGFAAGSGGCGAASAANERISASHASVARDAQLRFMVCSSTYTHLQRRFPRSSATGLAQSCSATVRAGSSGADLAAAEYVALIPYDPYDEPRRSVAQDAAVS